LPDANLETPADDEKGLARQYVRVRSNRWPGSKRAWLWTLTWGVRIRPRGGPAIDLRWTDMAGVQLVSMNMVRASDQLWVRIRSAGGFVVLLTAREFGDWRTGLLKALQSNGVTVRT
jgi:hypothetical protein